jgi:hypothetical protein
MIIELLRRYLHEHWTIGELFIDGVFSMYTLEDRVRAPGVKIPGLTAIPAKVYRIVRKFSPHFSPKIQEVIPALKGASDSELWMPFLADEDFPLLAGKPMFGLVMIHWGNDDADTKGCPLVGLEIDLEFGRVLKSRAAFAVLRSKIDAAFRRGEHVELRVRQDLISWDRRKAA